MTAREKNNWTSMPESDRVSFLMPALDDLIATNQPARLPGQGAGVTSPRPSHSIYIGREAGIRSVSPSPHIRTRQR